MNSLPWITDRLPTAEDADYKGDVVCVVKGGDSWHCTQWYLLPIDTPWLRFNSPSAAKNATPSVITSHTPDEVRGLVAEAVTAEIQRHLQPGGLLHRGA